MDDNKPGPGSKMIDVVVTMLCWTYFVFGFLFFFSFFYAAAYLFSDNRERSFQYLNHIFYKGFLWLLRTLAPRHKWLLDPHIQNIHGAIIVCNHTSYLDPLIFISLFPRHKTIVKTQFFHAPVFGWMLKVSGYLPATTEGVYAGRMIEQMESMGKFLKDGGNLFVFPEGTRNPDSVLGEFHKGVFKIARMHRYPVYILKLCNTDKLFIPGKFFFNTREQSCISMEILDCIQPETEEKQRVISVSGLEKQVRHIYQTGSSCDEVIL
ncbi:MAG: lysophospholipid acyltransferase family protein [Thermodesulfobacteriota bacterium]|nr:lysophospholipid acyltransferase family protein [Thermodesulfobacteriota bacterium]